ncbi:hydroxymethylbilane synthase [Aurantibacter aestuarii]|uniref:Hydroxymethylbilane synthase n=1 Tax=Aurantibacter aestuarii TaxID=1266046 RepID=A0A2T1NDA7_9FLAO|nr:hydroxymethylbilane synthase [Aurantibacter aestuarii]PSG90421.1 hydroxymethylbilane synthase [Aurantibacter aestuarii]
MSKTIRIGTRDSQLALWQANAVKSQLEHLGHECVLVPVKSTGDIVLDKPLYELGVTGIFTKTLDIALLNGDIDVAVHSLKDVPTMMPEGIIQAAVLKRGNTRDMLVFNDSEEFLSQPDAIIATSSLRRRAQWLNRFPTHKVEDIRGNVNSRLEKLENSETWNGAIFAAAGLGRLGIKPENSFNLDWMIPAPAQGAVMVAALEENVEVIEICKEINDEKTEICTSIERKFLRILEGGCSAPIGALAFYRDKEDDICFKGILLSRDGTRKIEVEKIEPFGKHHDIANFCAHYILDKGGNSLVDIRDYTKRDETVFSTKALTDEQNKLFHDGIKVNHADFVKVNINRLAPHVLKKAHKNVVITSQNAVEAIVNSVPAEDLNFKTIYCVGRRTKKLIEQKIGKVKHQAKNAETLANYLLDYMEGTEVTYFCSDIRLDALPTILGESNIKVEEIEAYSTKFDPLEINTKAEGVMFYSPSTIDSFVKENTIRPIAFCIGETTAKHARKHFEDVRVAKVPTVESVIELVNEAFV